MLNTYEKRKVVQEWIENASEEEVEVFYESLIEESNDNYTKDVLIELDRRRERHLSGETPSFTLDELNKRLNSLKSAKYGL